MNPQPLIGIEIQCWNLAMQYAKVYFQKTSAIIPSTYIGNDCQAVARLIIDDPQYREVLSDETKRTCMIDKLFWEHTSIDADYDMPS